MCGLSRTLVLFSVQVLLIENNGTDDEILNLTRLQIRQSLSQTLHWDTEHFTLICLFFLHYRVDEFIGQLTCLTELFETHRLRK